MVDNSSFIVCYHLHETLTAGQFLTTSLCCNAIHFETVSAKLTSLPYNYLLIQT